jgi:hypothetical protein
LLLRLLSSFSGDLHAYDALCAKYASVLNGQPALVEHERRLREKVRGLAAASACCASDTCAQAPWSATTLKTRAPVLYQLCID